MIIIGFCFWKKNWRFISWRARWPADGIIVGAQFPIKTLPAPQRLLQVKQYAIDALIFQTWVQSSHFSKFVQDYQDFNHRGFPNMGPGGGGHGDGPHGGGSRGGGRHGGNFG
ncbi:hypothetical protein Tco_0029438, partial [Tanacetum coccineum]